MIEADDAGSCRQRQAESVSNTVADPPKESFVFNEKAGSTPVCGLPRGVDPPRKALNSPNDARVRSSSLNEYSSTDELVPTTWRRRTRSHMSDAAHKTFLISKNQTEESRVSEAQPETPADGKRGKTFDCGPSSKGEWRDTARTNSTQSARDVVVLSKDRVGQQNRVPVAPELRNAMPKTGVTKSVAHSLQSLSRGRGADAGGSGPLKPRLVNHRRCRYP